MRVGRRGGWAREEERGVEGEEVARVEKTGMS